MSFNRRRYQYDIQTGQVGPTPADPYSPTVMDWQQPESQPNPSSTSRIGKYAVAVAVASGLFWSSFTPPVQAKQATGGSSSPTVLRFKVSKKFASEYPSVFWSGFTPPVVGPSVGEVASASKVYQEQPNFSNKSARYREALDSCDGQQPLGAVVSEIVLADKWQPVYPQQIQAKRYLLEAIESCDGAGSSPIELQPVITPQHASGGASNPTLQKFKVNKRFAATSPYLSWSGFTPSTPQLVPVPQSLYPDRLGQQGRYTQQYFFYDSSLAPEVVTVDRWERAQSQPYPARKVQLTADIPVFFWSQFTPPEVITVGGWNFNQLPQPNFSTLARRYQNSLLASGMQVWQISTQPETVLADKWQPVYPHRTYQKQYFVNQQYVTNVFAQLASAVSLNWEAIYPDRIQKKNGIQPSSTLVEALGVDEIWWEPVLWDRALPADPSPPMPSYQQTSTFSPVSTAPEAVTADRWVQPQSQPYPYRKVLLVTQQRATFWSHFTPVFIPPQHGSGGGSSPQLLRFKTKKYRVQEQTNFVPIVTELITADKWLQPTNQPYPYRRQFHVSQQKAAFSAHFTPPPPVVVPADAFATQQVQPRRLRFSAAAYEFTGSTNLYIPSVDGWGQPTNQPVPGRQYLASSQQQAVSFVAPIIAEVVTVDKWFNQTSQPYPSKHVLLEAIESSDGQSPLGSIPEGTNPSVWIQQQPQPFPVKRSILTADVPAVFWNTSTSPEVVSEDRWHHTQSQPWPIKKSLLTAQIPSTFWSNFTPPEQITVSAWGYHHDPQPDFTAKARRYQVSLIASGMMPWQISTANEVVTEDRWHQPVSQPFPTRPYRPADYYPSHFWNTSTQPEVVHVDAWKQTESQPYPYKPYRPASVYPSFFWSGFIPETITVDKWFNQTSEPIYPKRIATAQIPSNSWSTFTPVVVTADKFVQPQSQPYPYRRALGTADQQAVAWNTSTQPEAVTEDRWHPNWPQPYPAKRRVPAAYYPSFFWNTVVAETSNVEATLIIGVTQPYPYRKNLHTSNQLYQFWSGFTPLFANWLPEYPDKVEGKKYLNTSQVPYLSWNTSIEGEDVLADKWQPVYPQPYPYAKVLPVQQQLAQFWSTLTPPPTLPSVISGTGSVVQGFVVSGTVTQGLRGTGNVT